MMDAQWFGLALAFCLGACYAYAIVLLHKLAGLLRSSCEDERQLRESVNGSGVSRRKQRKR